MFPTFTRAEDMFPELGLNAARVVWEDDSGDFVLYSLGDGRGTYPWQHVYVRYLAEGGYSVRWTQTVLSAEDVDDPAVMRHVPRKQLLFLYGRRVRRLAHEEAMHSALRRLRRRCDGSDFLRAWQVRGVVLNGLYESLWGDVVRLESLRISALTPAATAHPPYCLTWLRLARRVLRRYPVPQDSRAHRLAVWVSHYRRWRWRRTLAGRVGWLYPLLCRADARAFAATIAWEADSVGGVV
jgi:hypothetical protein